MKRLPQFTLFLFFALLLLAGCEKDSILNLKEVTLLPTSLTQSTLPAENLPIAKPFCSIMNLEKDGTVKLQKWFNCDLDTLKFTIEKFAPLVSPFSQIETLQAGLENGKGFSDFDYQIEFVPNVEDAHIKVVWGKVQEIVPPFNNPFPETLAAAALPTDSKINGYMYLNTALVWFDKRTRVITHEFGHIIGKEHEGYWDFVIMNPYVLHTPAKVQPHEKEETNEAYEVNDCI